MNDKRAPRQVRAVHNAPCRGPRTGGARAVDLLSRNHRDTVSPQRVTYKALDLLGMPKACGAGLDLARQGHNWVGLGTSL